MKIPKVGLDETCRLELQFIDVKLSATVQSFKLLRLDADNVGVKAMI